MRFKLTIQLLLLFLSTNLKAQVNSFEIKIIQDSIVAPLNGEVQITKKPFKIEVVLNDIEGVYLFAAFKDSIYKLNATDSIPGFADLPAMSMAEESFNPDQELLIDDEGWAYWFYNKKQDWHRFDKKVEVKGKKITGTKSIKQFYFGKDQKVLSVKDVTMPLYLFFVSAKEEDNNSGLKEEIQRYKLKVNWK